ncbi:MAG: BglII/BstYI family type II restriction endonuclease [Acidimicrobiales bacterium]
MPDAYDSTDLVAGDEAPDLPGSVGPPTLQDLPAGYSYGVTRYADVILRESFPTHFNDLHEALATLSIPFADVAAGGGNRSPIAVRFDESLHDRGWGKRTIEITKLIDSLPVMKVRGHEIDMFKAGSASRRYPGIGVEMEWNNKDPFFDRDLSNFAALHREGVLALGVIVTRGTALQTWLRFYVDGGKSKYGASTTWWDKLVPRVNLGGGGECPLLLIGIETGRMQGQTASAAP